MRLSSKGKIDLASNSILSLMWEMQNKALRCKTFHTFSNDNILARGMLSSTAAAASLENCHQLHNLSFTQLSEFNYSQSQTASAQIRLTASNARSHLADAGFCAIDLSRCKINCLNHVTQTRKIVFVLSTR